MTKTERLALVKECRVSGITAKAWCKAKGIQYRQYVAWATKLNREENQIQPQQWADVTLAKEESSTDEIRLSCGNGCNSVAQPPFVVLFM
ncbi:MAG: hypothetical protein VR69_10880 [Peptococcaceae bacterium BRH_c4b]|nr:MAG: hypothetical protein VR69_10880 [Peptococcaceae bacterium BRH_c4b]